MAIPVENGDMCDSEDREVVTFSDLCSQLESNESCLDLAVRTRLLPGRGGLDCVQCRASRSVVWTKRLSQSNVPFILFCKACRKTISLCRNTVLSGCRVNVRQYLQSTYCWLLGLSVREGASQSDLSAEVCQNIYSLNQEVCYVLLSRGSRAVGGPDLTVEIGDVVLSRRKHITKPGQKPKTVLYKDIVYVGHCFETKDNFVLKVDRADLNTLLELIMVMVLPGSKIIVDGCHKYSEFAVENYDISFHAEELGIPDKLEPRRFRFAANQTEPGMHLMQQIYFKRKGKLQTCSQRFSPFLADVVRVHPGYGSSPLKPLTLQEFASKT